MKKAPPNISDRWGFLFRVRTSYRATACVGVISPPKCRQRATCRAGRLFSLWAWYIFAAMLFPVTLQYNGFISLNKAPYSKIKVLGCGVFILNNRIILPYLTFENKRLSSLLKRSSGDVTKHAGRSLFAFVSDRPHLTRNGLQRRVVS